MRSFTVHHALKNPGEKKNMLESRKTPLIIVQRKITRLSKTTCAA